MSEETDRAFNAAKRVLCCLQKDADIPQVEAVIRLVEPVVTAYWLKTIDEIMADLERSLDTFDDDMLTPSIDALARAGDSKKRDKLLEDLILILLALMLRRVNAQPPTATTDIIASAAVALMGDGAASIGEALDLGQSPTLQLAAQADLMTLLRGRVALRAGEIEGLLRTFLTSAGARSVSAGALSDAAATASGALLATRAAWRAALVEALGASSETWVPFVVDQWAYRWFNIGAVTAAKQNGVVALQAQAVLDHRTSPFCRWVNGRVISMERAQRQIDRHVEAALAGDINAMMANWPLLTFKASDTAPDFAVKFESVGLPPYHGRCRTRAVPIILTG